MKYHETPEFKRLQKEWYGRLAADGFQDIEDHIEWRLRASTVTVSLETLRQYMDNIPPSNMDDWLSSNNPLFDWPDSYKAKYYQLVGEIVAQGYRQKLDSWMLEVWAHHADGLGQRQIAQVMGTTRAKVRVQLAALQKTVRKYLRQPAPYGKM